MENGENNQFIGRKNLYVEVVSNINKGSTQLLKGKVIFNKKNT